MGLGWDGWRVQKECRDGGEKTYRCENEMRPYFFTQKKNHIFLHRNKEGIFLYDNKTFYFVYFLRLKGPSVIVENFEKIEGENDIYLKWKKWRLFLVPFRVLVRPFEGISNLYRKTILRIYRAQIYSKWSSTPKIAQGAKTESNARRKRSEIK